MTKILLVSDSKSELVNRTAALVEIINIIYVSRLEIKICRRYNGLSKCLFGTENNIRL